jgi:hypothetical protein
MPKMYHVLAIEPNKQLVQPYAHFELFAEVLRVESLEQAALELEKVPGPDIILMSASFSPERGLKLMEMIKQACRDQVVPLIMVVNLAQPLSFMPGTTWGSKFGIIHSLSSVFEVISTVERVTQ